MAEIQLHLYRYCFQKIHPKATVCHPCSNAQMWWRNFVKLPDVISLGALLIAFYNLRKRFRQIQLPKQPAATCSIAQSLIEVAEMIPRTTEVAAFQGGSLPEKDKALLKDRVESLRKQISQCK